MDPEGAEIFGIVSLYFFLQLLFYDFAFSSIAVFFSTTMAFSHGDNKYTLLTLGFTPLLVDKKWFKTIVI